MKKLKTVLSYVLVAVAAASLTFSVLTFLTREEAPVPTKLEELQSLINRVYVGDVDNAAIEDGAAAGMVDALGDKWSHYMSREEFDQYKEQMNNSYVGVGITVQVNEEGYVTILRVEPAGPAGEAGILPKDVIIAVDGKDIHGQDIDTTKMQVRGEENTAVKLTVLRDGQELEFTVTRRLVESQVARSRMLENQIGLVTIVNFDSRAAEETIAAVERLMAEGAKGILFDVRYNPGGYKHELVALLDYLLPEGPLFRSVDYSGKESVDTSDERFLDIPMGVLMNEDSYSAAEFFAAALKEYGVAFTVGTPTTGKGRFQSTYILSDGSAATISIGTYRTPQGVDLTDVGLTPDILLELEDDLYIQIYNGQVEPKDDPQI